jgi:hypothetical protein
VLGVVLFHAQHSFEEGYSARGKARKKLSLDMLPSQFNSHKSHSIKNNPHNTARGKVSKTPSWPPEVGPTSAF